MKKKGYIFQEVYSGLLYNYHKSINSNEFNNHQEAADFILDNIVNISKSLYRYSNNFSHSFIYVNSEEDFFTNVYSSSSAISKYIQKLKDEIFQNDSIINDDHSGIKKIQDWVIDKQKPLLIKFSSTKKVKYDIFAYVNNSFQRKVNFLYHVGPVIQKAYTFLRETVQNNNEEPISDFMLLLPVLKLIQSKRTESSGLFFGFFKHNFKLQKSGDVNFKSYDELQNIQIALSSVYSIASDYEKKQQIEINKNLEEKNRILEGIQSINRLYAHNFSNHIKKINRTIIPNFKQKKLANQDEFVSHFRDLANDLKVTRDNLLLPFSDYKSHYENKIELFGFIKKIIQRNEFPEINFQVSIKRKKYIYFDKNILFQVVVSIIDNSLKALDYKQNSNKIILIEESFSVDNKGREFLKLDISDNGCGIDPTIKDKLLRFSGVSQWKMKKHLSFGIGLYTCRGLLKMFNGNLDIEENPKKFMSTTISLWFYRYASI